MFFLWNQFGTHGKARCMGNTDELAAGVVLKTFTKVANAGDAFSACLATYLFGRSPILAGEGEEDSHNVLLVGSILHWADCHTIVCGAGFISSEAKLNGVPRKVLLVRGPRTHELLLSQGVQAPRRYADPGVLAPRLFTSCEAVRGRVGVVPHYKDRDTPWVTSCKENGVLVVDPGQPLPEYFSALQSCEVILSSSLHGLIFAHAFGRPAIWIELGNCVLGGGFKFLDYYAGLGLVGDKVRRIRICEDSDPDAIAAIATCPPTKQLEANAEEALWELTAGFARR